MGSHLEIWDAEMWQAELADIENSDDDERWSELGI
jgi:DNA-binding transcriptional regulator/RsmH inhibitor MraZ